MRDSGCGFAAVRATYVKPEQYLNEYEDLLLMDCTPRTFQKATVFVETKYYTGDLKVLVVDNPVVDIVFGNVVKIKGNEQRMAENHQIQSNEVKQMGHGLYSSIDYEAPDAEGEKMKHLPDNSINQQEESNAVRKMEYLPDKTIKQQTQNNAVEKMKYLTDDNINQDAINNATEKAEHLSDNDINQQGQSNAVEKTEYRTDKSYDVEITGSTELVKASELTHTEQGNRDIKDIEQETAIQDMTEHESTGQHQEDVSGGEEDDRECWNANSCETAETSIQTDKDKVPKSSLVVPSPTMGDRHAVMECQKNDEGLSKYCKLVDGYPKKVKEVKVRYIVKPGLLYRVSYPRRKRHPRRQLFVLTKQVDKEVEERGDFDNCRRYGNKHDNTDSENEKTKMDNACDDKTDSENEKIKMDNACDDNTDSENEKTKMDNACDDNTDSENEKTKMDNACDDNTDSENEKTKMDNACDDNTDSENEKTKVDNACDDNTDSENEKTKMDNACDDNTDSENEKTKMDNACDDNTDSENEKIKMDNACDDNTDSENEKTKMDNACDDNTDSKNEKPIWIMKVLIMLLQRIMMEQSHGISSHVEQHDER